MKWILTMLLTFWALPFAISAAEIVKKDAKVEKTWESFNLAVDSKTQEIKQIVFGPITKLIGVLGIAYGVISTCITASYRPIMTYGGIGLLMAIVPYFIDTVFGAVLPGM